MDVGATKITFQNVTIATGQTTGLVPFRLIHASTVFLQPNITTYYITLSSMLLGTGFNYVLLPILLIALNNISLGLSIIHVGFIFNFSALFQPAVLLRFNVLPRALAEHNFRLLPLPDKLGWYTLNLEYYCCQFMKVM
jgi:hypothetical protein